MACERYRDALTDAAAGESLAAELEAHLAGCAACRQALDALRRTLALVDADLGQLLATEPSPDLAARIRQAASEPQASPAWRPGFVLQALAAAAVLAAALVVMRGRAPAPRPVAVAARTPQASAAAPRPGPPTAVVAPVAPSRVAVQRRPQASAPRPLALPEPQVLVPPGQAEALVRLVTLLHRDRLALPLMGTAGEASTDLAEPGSINVASIEIVPLEIVPLDPAESSGT